MMVGLAIHMLWGCPQSLLGLLLAGVLMVTGAAGPPRHVEGALVVHCDRIPGAFALGPWVFVGFWTADDALRHEIGHTRQSQIIGPLYIPIVGVASWAHFVLYGLGVTRGRPYRAFWTEAWADRLGGRNN